MGNGIEVVSQTAHITWNGEKRLCKRSYQTLDQFVYIALARGKHVYLVHVVDTRHQKSQCAIGLRYRI